MPKKIGAFKSDKKRVGDTMKPVGFRPKFLGNLRARKEEVEKTLKGLKESQKEYQSLHSADDFIEEGDHAEREISAQTYYSLLERKNKELEKIELLIRKVQEEEEFGLCEECGEQIPEQRLLVLPEATYCVPCQRELEKFDLRRKTAERSLSTSRGKKELQWEDMGDTNDKDDFIIESDMDHISFVDLEETELEDNPGSPKIEEDERSM